MGHAKISYRTRHLSGPRENVMISSSTNRPISLSLPVTLFMLLLHLFHLRSYRRDRLQLFGYVHKCASSLLSLFICTKSFSFHSTVPRSDSPAKCPPYILSSWPLSKLLFCTMSFYLIVLIFFSSSFRNVFLVFHLIVLNTTDRTYNINNRVSV